MKWVLIVILISVIMLIARAVSEQYKDKYDFYYNLHLFLNQFKVFVSAYQDYLSGKELNLTELKLLEKNEQQELKDIVERLGKNDSQNELKQVEHFLCTIENHLSKAEKDKIKLCPMIIKLSLLFAIALAILLI